MAATTLQIPVPSASRPRLSRMFSSRRSERSVDSASSRRSWSSSVASVSSQISRVYRAAVRTPEWDARMAAQAQAPLSCFREQVGCRDGSCGCATCVGFVQQRMRRGYELVCEPVCVRCCRKA